VWPANERTTPSPTEQTKQRNRRRATITTALADTLLVGSISQQKMTLSTILHTCTTHYQNFYRRRRLQASIDSSEVDREDEFKSERKREKEERHKNALNKVQSNNNKQHL